MPSIHAAVEAAAQEVGTVRTLGASIVVDGVDELGYQGAAELLTQARVLVGEARALAEDRTRAKLIRSSYLAVDDATDDIPRGSRARGGS